MTRKYRRPLAALLLALGVVATATLGSAATLTVNAASISTFTVTHPCPGNLAATTPTTAGTVSTVSVDPPDACAGLMIAVAVNDGAVVRQGTATAPATGSVTVTLDGAYTPSETGITVLAIVDGWHLDTTWGYDPPAPPADVIVAVGFRVAVTLGDWYDDGGLVCVPVEVWSEAGNRTWRVDIDTTASPFNGSTPTFTGLHAAFLAVGPGDGPGWISVTGVGAYSTVQHNKTSIEFNVCG